MEQKQFHCPHCGGIILLSDLERHALESSTRELEEKFRKEQEIFRKEQEDRENIMKREFVEREALAKKEMWAKAQTAAETKKEEEFREKLIELQSLRERDEKSREREIAFLREKQIMENKQKDLELEKERAVIAAKKEMEEQMKKESSERNTLELEKYRLDFEKRLAEKEKQTEILKKALDDATMKANQGSMQIQGETQENALKQALQSEFPIDSIDDVPTGIK